MSNKSFNEFYYVKDNELHSIEEICREYKIKDGNIAVYRDNIFCPECRKAKLRFTHQTHLRKAFLSKIPTSKHEEGCSYINEYATKSQIKRFIEELNENQIKDRLEAILNRLLFMYNKDIIRNNNVINIENPFVININSNLERVIHRTIPRKSLNLWFNKDEENKIYLFYGRVKLKVEEIKTKDKIFYRLMVEIKKKDRYKYKTNIFRGYIKDEIDEKAIYDIALLGHIEFYNGNPEIKTETLLSIMFRKVK